MSDTAAAEHPERPMRARQPRAEAQAGHRRRRRAGSLNRMAQFTLDIFEPEQLDLENYVYRWVNDEKGRIRQATRNDDYDFVTTAELGGDFDPDSTDSESTERVRILVGSDKGGKDIYAYLCKKPRGFWETDNDEVVRAREDMMAGRVYRAEATEEEETRPGGDGVFYASKSNTIGHAAERRRGPIPRNFK